MYCAACKGRHAPLQASRKFKAENGDSSKYSKVPHQTRARARREMSRAPAVPAKLISSGASQAAPHGTRPWSGDRSVGPEYSDPGFFEGQYAYHDLRASSDCLGTAKVRDSRCESDKHMKTTLALDCGCSAYAQRSQRRLHLWNTHVLPRTTSKSYAPRWTRICLE